MGQPRPPFAEKNNNLLNFLLTLRDVHSNMAATIAFGHMAGLCEGWRQSQRCCGVPVGLNSKRLGRFPGGLVRDRNEKVAVNLFHRRIPMSQPSSEEIAFGRFADLHRIYSISRSTAYVLIEQGLIKSKCTPSERLAHWHSPNRL